MDSKKLIEQLKYYGTTYAIGDNLGKEIDGSDELMLNAATALSTLQAENKRLNKIVCSIPTTPDSGRTVSQYDKEMSMCAYLDDLEAENEKLRAELEQVTAERDAAVKDLNEFLAMDELCPIQCEWCKWKDTFCDGKTPEWRGLHKEE